MDTYLRALVKKILIIMKENVDMRRVGYQELFGNCGVVVTTGQTGREPSLNILPSQISIPFFP